jgi:RimJ/RimL family protein N-acetyltransferase
MTPRSGDETLVVMRSTDSTGSTTDRADLRVVLLTDPAEVASRVAGLFAADPIGTNIAATVLGAALAGRPQAQGSFWAIVEDGAGRAVALAMSSAGFPAFLPPMPDATAELLADHLVAGGHDVPGLSGDARATLAFARRWCELTGQDAERLRAEGVHLLAELVPPVDVPGLVRPATADDAPLVADWFAAFEHEAEDGDELEPAVLQQRVSAFVQRIPTGRILLWEDGGLPVSLAGWQLPAGSPPVVVGRIGPVYTPREHRRHGYAAGATAAAARALLDAGADRVMLYTDLANPTSNGVYARLGFRRIGDSSRWAFRPPAGP